MRRFWQDFTSKELSDDGCQDMLAILPTAAIEAHGPHLPLSTDTTIVAGLIDRLVAGLPSDSKAVMLPIQQIGKSNEHLRFPGTLTFDWDTVTNAWLEIGASVARAGVKKLLVLNSHGGNRGVIDIVTRELRVRHGLQVFSVSSLDLGVPDGLFDDYELSHGIHGGDIETSMMLVLAPQLVNFALARNFSPLTLEIERKYSNISLKRGARFAWGSQDLHAAGVCGDASAASAQKGEAVLSYITSRLVELVAEIEDFPITWLKEEIEWTKK